MTSDYLVGPLQLVFIRHAESIGNQQKRMQGHQDDSLSEMGQRQAERLAQRLAAAESPTCIYSSPLKRAAQTAEILQAQLTLPVSDLTVLTNQPPYPPPLIYADELREFQNGILTGLTWAEAQQQYPELCTQLEQSLDWIQIPEAESLQEARDRATDFIQRLLQQHQSGERIWVVSHSWILQQLISVLLGCDRVWGLSIRNTALFEFWIDRSRWQRSDQTRLNSELWRIRWFNDCHHLDLS